MAIHPPGTIRPGASTMVAPSGASRWARCLSTADLPTPGSPAISSRRCCIQQFFAALDGIGAGQAHAANLILDVAERVMCCSGQLGVYVAQIGGLAKAQTIRLLQPTLQLHSVNIAAGPRQFQRGAGQDRPKLRGAGCCSGTSAMRPRSRARCS